MNALDQLLERLAGASVGSTLLLAGVALLLLIWLLVLAQWLAGRRTREIANALDDSVRGHLAETAPQRATHLAVAFDSPPDPFAALAVEFTMGGGAPLAALVALLTRRQLLCLHATLPSAPASQLVWDAVLPTDRATGRGPETKLWVTHRLVYGPGEYAVRGDNTASLEHAFGELQARFGPFLRAVMVQATAEPHITVQMHVARLNREDIPALISALRALGRAARI